MKYRAESEEVARVLQHLHKGKENAVKHDVLMSLTGLNDRRLRQALEQARYDYCIINNSDGRGYYIARTKAEAKIYYKQEINRANSIYKRLTGTRDFLNITEGQLQFGEEES